jgi:alkenylglycerophosphocholine/alkenylglycerophosphoethanolamine hydrolase
MVELIISNSDDSSPRAGRAGPLGVTAALAYVVALALHWPLLGLLAKPVPVLCLAGAVLRRRSNDARLVGAGLLLSAAGDVLLEFPSLFLIGLIVFLAAHLVYLAAFLQRVRALRLAPLAPLLAWTTATVAWLWNGLGPMRRPVVVYVAAITAMMWRAAAVGGWAAGGALLFGLSDTLIALDRFGSPIPGVRYPIILLYWAGQAGIAISVLADRMTGAWPAPPSDRPRTA